jgi:hypothetical protein
MKFCVLLIAKTHVHISRPYIILSDDISFLRLLWGTRVSLEQDPAFCNCMQKPWEHIQVIPLLCCEHGFQLTTTISMEITLHRSHESLALTCTSYHTLGNCSHKTVSIRSFPLTDCNSSLS